MNKRKRLVEDMIEIALMASLAFVLDYLQGLLPRIAFMSGGSIGFAMLPIYFISLRRGFVQGLLTGLIVSVLQLFGSSLYVVPGSLAFLQVLLDYILAYPLVGLAGLFYKQFQNANQNKDRIKWIIISCLIGGLGKLSCHFLSGFIFWGEYAPTDFLGGPVVYSLVYNAAYVIPNIIINCIVLIILVLKQPSLFELKILNKTADHQ